MEHHALHHVIGGVRDRDHVCAGLHASPVEKLVSERAGARLNGAARQGALAALDDQLNA